MMKLFEPISDELRSNHTELYALYELAYTVVDFLAAAMFVVGSALFFREETTTIATWLFLVGSVFFGLKPTIRLTREIHMFQLGKYESLSEKVQQNDAAPTD